MRVIIEGRVPSKKNSKRIIHPRGRRKPILLSSENYLKFEANALEQIKKQNINVTTPKSNMYYMEYIFHMRGKAATDADNMEASINDILQKAGIITDDKNIFYHLTLKLPNQEEYKTEVFIEPLSIKELLNARKLLSISQPNYQFKG